MWKYSEHLHLKNILFASWTSVCSFFAPVASLLGWVVFFIIADFLSGLWASRRRGEKWQSARFRESVCKTGTYLFTLICAFVFDSRIIHAVNMDIKILGWVAAFICGVEFYSILENFYSATGNRVFYILTQLTNKKLKDAVGYHVKDVKDGGQENEEMA